MNSMELEAGLFFHTYKRLQLEIERGEGVHLVTKDGRRYLDLFGGLAVNALGYAHPRLLAAIREQCDRYIHLSNYFLQQPQLRLAELLISCAGMARVFFTNSGTESIEGAIKIARKWGSARKKTNILSFSNAFHGRTMGALSLMDRSNYRDGFAPFLDNCRVIGHNNVEELHRNVGPHTAAVILEFIQGEGGIRPVSCELIDELNALKERYGFLLIADEIQSGVGRTGKFFGFEHYRVKPDIVVIAKPLGGGLPLGAILGAATVADVLEPGNHGTTFGGNPVACAAGLVVLDEIVEQGLMQNAEAVGGYLRSQLIAIGKEFPTLVREVRGFGLMIGMELTGEGDSVVTAMRDRGILLNCTNQTVLRFLPPLILGRDHVDQGIGVLREVLRVRERQG